MAFLLSSLNSFESRVACNPDSERRQPAQVERGQPPPTPSVGRRSYPSLSRLRQGETRTEHFTAEARGGGASSHRETRMTRDEGSQVEGLKLLLSPPGGHRREVRMHDLERLAEARRDSGP
jgi:hypothetical protein